MNIAWVNYFHFVEFVGESYSSKYCLFIWGKKELESAEEMYVIRNPVTYYYVFPRSMHSKSNICFMCQSFSFPDLCTHVK